MPVVVIPSVADLIPPAVDAGPCENPKWLARGTSETGDGLFAARI